MPKEKAKPVAAQEKKPEPQRDRASDPYQLQSLDRAVAVLELLGESEGPLGLADVCERMELHKSTAHRALMVLERTGHHGTGSDMASSFANYGQRVSGPEVGAIAVMGRHGGGHVGIITGIDAHGNPIMISGNNGNRVREAPISRGRIYAYVMPD